MNQDDKGELSDAREQPATEQTWEKESERRAKADRYFQVHLSNQRLWYSRWATRSKAIAELLAITVLAAGAATTVIQVVESCFGVKLATACLGALVVIAKGLERIWAHESIWASYRATSEAMKREYRLYINNAGGYEASETEDQAFRAFVEQIERIIADETKQYWQHRDIAKGSGDASGEPDTPSAKGSEAETEVGD